MRHLRRPVPEHRGGAVGGGVRGRMRIDQEEAAMSTGAGKRVGGRLPFVALVAVAGCATSGGAPDDQRERNEIVIEVQNDHFNQATIYPPSGSMRIGIVGGKSKATFNVEWHFPEVEIRIRLLTGGSALLRPHFGREGETWKFIIPATCC